MTEIITAIQNALAKVTTHEGFNTSLIKALGASDMVWKLDYPIALVNAAGRIDASEDRCLFKERKLLDTNGLTPTKPSASQFNAIAQIGTQYLQRVTVMCLESEPVDPPHFQVKRQNDYWKKIQDVGHIEAMIETSEWHEDVGVCDVEFSLREIIRKRKEVHALKDIGFVWIAVTYSDASEVFKHYFHDNYSLITTEKQAFHIGWSPTLREISMRSFVCPPE